MTNRAAAARYARALFEVSLAEADPQQVEREIGAFADVVRGHTELARVVEHPAVPAARKRALVEALLGAGPAVSPVVRRLLLILAERDRLGLIAGIVEAYRSRLLDHQQVVRAEITSAVALPADRVARVSESLAQATGRRVIVDMRVDPSIVGGVVTRIGTIVYDGSVSGQLERLKERLASAG